MNKFRVLLVVVASILVISLSFMSCGSSKDNSQKTIEDLLEHFSKTFEVGEEYELFYQAAGACDGSDVDLDGETVFILKFDINDAGSKSTLKEVKSTNTLKVGGLTFSAAVNGSFVVCYTSDFSEKEKLLKSFNSF
ncbi:MAG: hypothetical protein K6G18_12680 [Treponema sp.]|nr:hypothetical protein [Treponema sp.]